MNPFNVGDSVLARVVVNQQYVNVPATITKVLAAKKRSWSCGCTYASKCNMGVAGEFESLGYLLYITDNPVVPCVRNHSDRTGSTLTLTLAAMEAAA